MLLNLNLKTFLLLILHYSFTCGIFIRMHFHSPHCYVKHVTANEQLKINYIVTGEGEKHVRF